MFPQSPLRFHPLFRPYLWGGERLGKLMGKSLPGPGPWAESWEVVDHGADQSVVADGPWEGWTLRNLIDAFPDEVLGNQQSKPFPLLLKYLDCHQVLSVQVHPDDPYASRMDPPDLGKTEAWYVVHAEPGAKIYAGLQQGIDRAQLADAIANGATEQALQVLHPNPGDCVFIPAGTVHALGSGLLVVEIQQSSDSTFRLYDWNRVDGHGNSRPLHVDQALEVINFEAPAVQFARPEPLPQPAGQRLVRCQHFEWLRWHGPCTVSLEAEGRFRLLTLPEGQAHLHWMAGSMSIDLGQSVLLPACHLPTRIELAPDSTLLLAQLPNDPTGYDAFA
ncbi:MAG: type I phosphomannose isomerase catalytic subunit [Pirellulaceae bacterium]